MSDADEPGYTKENSPWKAAQRRALADLPLPRPPDSLETSLQLVVDHENQFPMIRARIAADLLVEMRAWFDEFVAKANEIEALDDQTPDDLLHVAQRSRELRAAGHQMLVVVDKDDEGNRLRPPNVRPATEEEIARITEQLEKPS